MFEGGFWESFPQNKTPHPPLLRSICVDSGRPIYSLFYYFGEEQPRLSRVEPNSLYGDRGKLAEAPKSKWGNLIVHEARPKTMHVAHMQTPVLTPKFDANFDARFNANFDAELRRQF